MTRIKPLGGPIQKNKEKHPDWEDDAYKALCRALGCVLCGTKQIMHAHHLRHRVPNDMKGGKGKKHHDHVCVGLCWLHHNEVHSLGEVDFERKHGVDLWEKNAELRKIYEENRND